MTYVVALSQPGINTLIVDTRVSWKDRDGEWHGSNTSLKSGLLFPGCMYARVGSSFGSRAFIREFKRSIMWKKPSITNVWDRFEEFARDYPYEDPLAFKLVLSSRHSGSPDFYVLDSQKGLTLVPVDHYSIATFGSGKDVLDEIVKDKIGKRIQEFLEFSLNNRDVVGSLKPHLMVPYLLSMWLCQLSLIWKKNDLESVKVGGVFHFNMQSGTSESGQRPALYIFNYATKSDIDEFSIHSWSYRIIIAKGALYLEKHVPEGQSHPGAKAYTETHIISDTAARYDASEIETKDLIDKVRARVDELPFYEFAGVAGVDPQLEGNFNASITNSSEKSDVWDDKGFFQSQFKEMIFSLFAESGYFRA
jgi:hypothetical protein